MHKRDQLAQMAFLTIATWMLPITTTKGQAPKGFASLRDSASACCEQYIKSEFLHFWDPYVLLRSDFYSKGQAQCPLV